MQWALFPAPISNPLEYLVVIFGEVWYREPGFVLRCYSFSLTLLPWQQFAELSQVQVCIKSGHQRQHKAGCLLLRGNLGFSHLSHCGLRHNPMPVLLALCTGTLTYPKEVGKREGIIILDEQNLVVETLNQKLVFVIFSFCSGALNQEPGKEGICKWLNPRFPKFPISWTKEISPSNKNLGSNIEKTDFILLLIIIKTKSVTEQTTGFYLY